MNSFNFEFFNQFRNYYRSLDELIPIFFTIFFILVYLSFPNNKTTFKKIFKKNNISNIDAMSVNIVFHCLLFLILSFFFNLDIVNIGYLIFLASLTMILMNLKSTLNYKNKSIVIIFFTFLFFYCIQISAEAGLGWDGLATWFYKTQIFYQNGSVLDFKDVPFPFYPHLGPYIWAFFWKISFSDYEFVGRFFFIIVFLISTLSLCLQIKNKNLQVILYISFVLFLTENILFKGYMEYLIFSLITIFTRFYFFDSKIFDKNKNILMCFLLSILFLLPWVKDEGLLGSIFLYMIIIFGKKFKNINKIIFSLFYFLLLFISYEIERNLKGIVDFQFPLELENLITFKSLFIYLELILEFIKVIIRYPIWIGIVFCFIYFAQYKRFFKNDIYTLYIVFAAQFLLMGVLYLLVSVDHAYHLSLWHMQSSTFRQILNISGLYSVLIIFYINQVENISMFKNFKSPNKIILGLIVLVLLNEKEFFKNLYDISFRPYHHRMIREHGYCSLNGYGFVKNIMSSSPQWFYDKYYAINEKLVDNDGNKILNNSANAILTNYQNLENIRVLNFGTYSSIDSLFYNNKKKYSEKYFFLINFDENSPNSINELNNYVLDHYKLENNINIKSYKVLLREKSCLLIEKTSAY
tara:strand:+ start:1583 stop:3490 length:1908 start_codon:yes stop_codon:yes gene_type:complete